MSGVGPSDGGYQYLRQRMTDLEESYRAEKKSSEKKNQAKFDALEKKHVENLRETEKDLDKTLQNIKEEASENVARDRKSSQAEVDRIKAQTYDRYGRYNGLEADTLKSELEDLQRSIPPMVEKHREDVSDIKKAQSERLQDVHDRHEREVEEIAKRSRDSAYEAYRNAFENQRSEYDTYKRQLQERQELLNSQQNDRVESKLDEATKAVEETRHTYERKARKDEESHNIYKAKTQGMLAAGLEKGTVALQRSHDQETQALRDQLKELQKLERTYAKERGKGTVDALDQFENENREKVRRMAEDYQAQIAALKAQAEASERYLRESNEARIRERNDHTQQLMEKLSGEHHKTLSDLNANAQADQKQSELQRRKDADLAEKRIDSLIANMSANKEKSLSDQSLAAQQTLARQRTGFQDQIDALEKELSKKYRTEDPHAVSPAVEAAVRKTLSGEYEKLLTEERNRNKKTVDSIQEEYSGRFNDLILDRQNKETQVNKQNYADQQIERSAFLSHMQDREMHEQEVLRNRDRDHERQIEAMQRTYGRVLNKQKRDYEELIQTMKNDAAIKIAAVRQENDFETRMTHRTFAAQQSDLIRDYDKKLADQKAEYEVKLDDLRNQKGYAVRDAEKKAKVILDEQIRSYEQKIAQMEYQHKERERMMLENFNDQIEKLKRANSLIIQKKG